MPIKLQVVPLRVLFGNGSLITIIDSCKVYYKLLIGIGQNVTAR